MKNILLYKILLLTTLMLLFWQRSQAQPSRSAYTSDNGILVSLEGKTGPYQFTSKDLLVRYNKTTQKIECILNLNTLQPASNAEAPPTMAYDVLFGAKYPDLVFEIDAPVQKINAANLYPETLNRTITIHLQGIANQTIIPVLFTPDKNSLFFSTNFDLMLDNFQASVPVKYLPMLTGRIQFVINNARWVNLELD